MKKNILRYTLFGFLALSLTTACTDDFESLNTNKHAATDADMEKDGKAVGSFFTQMINRTTVMKIGGDQDDAFASTGAYQHQIGISADSYSGYIGHTAGWARGRYNGTYSFTKGDEWGNAMFKMGMVQIMPAWAQMHAKALEQNQPQVAALADVVKVFAMHRVADHYGPIPYVNYRLGAIGQAYDALDKVYAKFFNELDSAIAVLTPYALAGNNILGDYDPIYFGDMLKWTKLANTLRLRLALRVVYADETLARREAEKSAACPVGFLEDADSRAQYNGLPNAAGVNPIWQQAYEWNENRMSAPMDSYLNGYKDPRISVYFVAAGDGKYHGVRQGVFADGANQSAYIGEKISNVNLSENSPVLYMAAAESYFLRAEAALRGWEMGGTAKSFYESGIKVSMQENGISSGVDSYIANRTNKPAAFTDNAGGDSAPAPSAITIAWNDKDDAFEENLERIIVQKWIASWGNSCEAWSEFRRTGYPRMFPVKLNYSDGAVSSDLQIRRLPYPGTEYNTNRAAVTAAAQLLGGPDNCGSRLWCDQNPNF